MLDGGSAAGDWGDIPGLGYGIGTCGQVLHLSSQLPQELHNCFRVNWSPPVWGDPQGLPSYLGAASGGPVMKDGRDASSGIVLAVSFGMSGYTW